MANITEYLQKILSARYGRDVRQSIHDGIEAINNEVAADKTEVIASKEAAAKSASEANKSAAIASEKAEQAASSEQIASTQATYAEESAGAAKTSETNAKASETEAALSAEAAGNHAYDASASASTATKMASDASAYASNAKASANTANTHATTASTKASEAATSANTASVKANSASASASLAESYAVGGTGTRENEDVDNAKYYKEQAERISQGLSGALIPMGTITYSQLAYQTKQAGYMYNISDSFTTDNTFKEGAGYTYAAGTNVYYTADGYWDCIAGTNVVGVKGAKEESYRQGNVNITPENIGALPEDGNALTATKATQDENGNNIAETYQTKTGDTANNIISFSSGDSANPTGWADIVTVESGETHASLFRKFSLAVKNLRYLYKMLGTTDISSVGDGTVTGVLSVVSQVVSKNANGLAPKLPNETSLTKFFRQDGTWAEPSGGTASDVTYDNTASGLTATNVQDAIDEQNSNLEKINNVVALNGSHGSIVSYNCDYYENGIYHIDVAVNITTEVPGNGQIVTLTKNGQPVTFTRRLDGAFISSSGTYNIVLLANTNSFIANASSIPVGFYKLKMDVSE